MNIQIKTIAVPLFVALSLIVGACSQQAVEGPDSIDDTVQEGVEGVEQGADDAGNAIDDGLKDLEKGAEDAAGTAQDGLKEGVEDTGSAVEDLGEEIPSSEQ
jgi:hypothetical protein